MSSLRVAVADDEAIMQMYLEEIVTDLGHDVVAVAANGRELVDRCRSCHPDLVITDIRMPVMDGVRAAAEICGECPLPVLFVTGYYEEHKNAIATSQDLLVYHRLVKPIGQAELRRGIQSVMMSFDEYQAMRGDSDDPGAAREGFQRLQQAKEHLMRREGIDGVAAFERLRSMAHNEGTTLAEAIAAVIDAEG